MSEIVTVIQKVKVKYISSDLTQFYRIYDLSSVQDIEIMANDIAENHLIEFTPLLKISGKLRSEPIKP